ncbi:hypothetical protein [Cohnella rhizosphaerae]|uniref:Uncharacterized protein n=1 Tax=Cohnella rhizosphaerae TaxID=1457232 RepID=A0A9X4KPH4_9BACL|nr:hypothetical protein [Cohnella rhizosphaerae]MDG0808684.1 hypothetical protein [Cohnella rhizosphaerae]
MFGAGYLVSALAAFLSVRLSLALTGGLLLLSLLMLVIHALELHEVERKDNFAAVLLSVAGYIVLFSIGWLLLFLARIPCGCPAGSRKDRAAQDS